MGALLRFPVSMVTVMTADRDIVRPSVDLLTEDDARELLADVLLPLCQEHGPKRVAKNLGGIDEKTVRNARDEKSLLCFDTAANLLALNPHAFEGVLNHFGRRSVPIGATCDTDALPAMTGAVHKLVVAASPTSVGGAALTSAEPLDAHRDIQTAFDALGALLGQIERIKRAA